MGLRTTKPKTETPETPEKRHYMHRVFFGQLKNDLEYLGAEELRNKIHDQSRFSILYFTLLIASVVIVTLGLLTNSTAVVIGGMLIAPLMWPMARIGYGIAHRSSNHLYRGFILIVASIIIGAVTAYLITSISPIKVINDEILARTSPTLMDLFIAITAGFVAAMAITQKKVADSLAGVAIAVSLMPPLSVVGISLALKNYEFSIGALLLFTVNAACITLVTTLVLIYTNYQKTKKFRIATKAAAFNLLLVLLLAIPLVQFLRSYSFELQSYGIVSSEMQDYIKLQENAEFENISVDQTDKSTMTVNADLLIPSDSVFTFADNEELVSILESRLNKKVLLNLRIQTIIEPITKDQVDNASSIDALSDKLIEELENLDSSFKISSISVTQSKEGSNWSVTADVLTNPDTVPTRTKVSELGDTISEFFGQEVNLNLTFIPRLTLKSSDQTLSQETRKKVEQITTVINNTSEISNFVLTQTADSASVSYTVVSNDLDGFTPEYLQQIKNETSLLVGKDVSVRVRLVQATDIGL
jgi:uncharacterized hydrophobic protein (TIGR00271 family)